MLFYAAAAAFMYSVVGLTPSARAALCSGALPPVEWLLFGYRLLVEHHKLGVQTIVRNCVCVIPTQYCKMHAKYGL